MNFRTSVNEAFQDKVDSTAADFLHFALRGRQTVLPARIEGAHSVRAASASKKDGLAAPLLFSLRARVALIPSTSPRRSSRERPRSPSTARIE